MQSVIMALSRALAALVVAALVIGFGTGVGCHELSPLQVPVDGGVTVRTSGTVTTSTFSDTWFAVSAAQVSTASSMLNSFSGTVAMSNSQSDGTSVYLSIFTLSLRSSMASLDPHFGRSLPSLRTISTVAGVSSSSLSRLLYSVRSSDYSQNLPSYVQLSSHNFAGSSKASALSVVDSFSYSRKVTNSLLSSFERSSPSSQSGNLLSRYSHSVPANSRDIYSARGSALFSMSDRLTSSSRLSQLSILSLGVPSMLLNSQRRSVAITNSLSIGTLSLISLPDSVSVAALSLISLPNSVSLDGSFSTLGSSAPLSISGTICVVMLSTSSSNSHHSSGQTFSMSPSYSAVTSASLLQSVDSHLSASVQSTGGFTVSFPSKSSTSGAEGSARTNSFGQSLSLLGTSESSSPRSRLNSFSALITTPSSSSSLPSSRTEKSTLQSSATSAFSPLSLPQKVSTTFNSGGSSFFAGSRAASTPVTLSSVENDGSRSQQSRRYFSLSYHHSSLISVDLFTPLPTQSPNHLPVAVPTSEPSFEPESSRTPSATLTFVPTPQSSGGDEQYEPTTVPTRELSRYFNTSAPTLEPTTHHEVFKPTSGPSIVSTPTSSPSAAPTVSTTTKIIESSEPTIPPSPVPSRSSAAPTITPSGIPAVPPSKEPVAGPTMFPTSIPITSPSAAPSTSSPTISPSVIPSPVPTVRPTSKDGLTCKPTTSPTVSPSADVTVVWDESYVYHGYLNQSALDSASGNLISFSSFNYRGNYVLGSCNDWKTKFLPKQLTLPLDSLYYTNISAHYLSQDVYSLASFRNSYVCKERSVVNNIVAAMKTGGQLSSTCNGHIWNVFSCSGISAFCVDCSPRCYTSSCGQNVSSIVLDSCLSCSSRKQAFFYSIGVGYDFAKLFPLVQQPLNVEATTSKLTVTVNVSTGGRVYCAAVDSSFVVTAPSQIRQYGNAVTASSGGNVTVLIKNVIAETNYAIYCYTEDFLGHTMFLADVIGTRALQTTPCCRALRFSTITTRLAESTQSSVNILALDSLPTRPSKVELSAVALAGCQYASDSAGSISFYPSSFTFLPSSLSLSKSFVFRGSPGCYSVVANMTTGDKYSNVSSTVYIRSMALPPDPPTLQKAQFSNDGTQLLVTFNSRTDYGASVLGTAAVTTSFTCSAVIRFVGHAATSCYWQSSTVLVAKISAASVATAGLILGSNVTLVRKVIMPQCPSTVVCQYSNESIANVVAPSDPVIPNVMLSSSALIAACDNIVIDASSTTGQASRPWSKVLWSVTGPGSNITDITALLNSGFSQATKGLVTIPNSVDGLNFLVPGIYSITLQLTNFLGTLGQATVSVTVSSSSGIRKVSIAGPSAVVQYRWQATSFFAISSSRGCSGSSAALQYSWSVFENYAFTSAIVNAASDKRYFKLKPYILETVNTYVIQVTVTADGVSTSSSVFVSLQSSGVSAGISGGSSRTISITDTVVLSADQSQDLDYNTAPLVYSWLCLQTYPVYGAICSNFMSSDDVLLTVPASSLMSNITDSLTTFSLSVVVSNSAKLSDTAEVMVTVIAATLPTVAISATGAAKFGVSSTVSVTGTLQGSRAFSAEWACSSLTLAAPLTLTPVNKAYSVGGSYGFPLVIAASSLAPGLTYSFQLLASYSDLRTTNEIASGTVTIVMNSPPLGGVLSVNPSNGTALHDLFFVSTFYWSDDPADFPITYVLSYYATGTTTSSVIKNSDTTSYVYALLGQGLELFGYSVSVKGAAYDIYGDFSEAVADVKVLPLTNLTLIQEATVAAMQRALADGNPGALSSAIGAAANSVNAVNCTVPRECASINRSPCSLTANTCGACGDGFIGISGDSNDPCVSLTTRRLNDCVDSSECVAGTCSNSACVENLKVCPNDCSSQGKCVYVSVDDIPLDVCLASNSFCRAQCLCQTNFFGRDCSLNEEELLARLEIREGMCSNLLTSAALQDLSSDAVLSRANLIASLLIDLDQLTAQAFESCASVLVLTVAADPVLVAQSSTAAQCMHAFSSVLALGSNIPRDLFHNVSAALNLLSAAIKDSLVPGQDFSSFTTDTFRISNGLVYAVDIQDSSLAAPQTGLETYLGAPKTTFQVNISETLASSFGVTILQYNSNPHGKPTNAVSTGLQLTQDGDEATAVEVTFVLQNLEPVDYYYYPSFSGNGTCQPAELPYKLIIQCNLGTMHHVNCSGIDSFSFNYTCPELSFLPSCTFWDASTDAYLTSQFCDVVDYTAMNTTCSCELGAASSSSSRRLQVVQTGVTEFSASADTVVNNFEQTLEVAATLNAGTIAHNPVIFSVTAGVMLVLLLGLYYTVKQDLREIDAGVAFYKKDLNSVVAVTADYTFAAFMHSITPPELAKTTVAKKITKVVTSYHEYIYSFAKFDEDGDFRTVTWLNAMGWTVMFLFMDTVLAALVFYDDGSCRTHTTHSDCVLQSSLDQMDTLCLWNDATQTCSFNHDIGNSTTSVFIMTGLITIFSIPFEKMFEISVDYVREFIVIKYLKGRSPRWRSPVDNLCLDLCMLETKKNVLLRAARLDLMKQHIDDVSVDQELETLQETRLSEHHIIPEERKGLFKQWEIGHFLFIRKQFSHHFTESDRKSTKKLRKRIARSRNRADEIVKSMNECETDYEREVLLLRKFQSSLLSSFRQYISKRFYDRGHAREEALKKAEIGFFHYASLIFLPCYIFFTLFFIFLFGVRLGSRTTNVWLTGAIVSWVEEMLVLRPLKIVLRWIMMSQIIFPDIIAIHEQLLRRARLIMSRTRGMINTQHASIQHFNAACRAARQFPHLQISRLLISVNDHDFPSLLASPVSSLQDSFKSTVRRAMEAVALMILMVITFLPADVQDIIIDTFGTVFAAGFLIAMAYLARISIAIPVVIVVLVLGSIFGGVFCVNMRKIVPVDALALEEKMVETARRYSEFKEAKKWRPSMIQMINDGQDAVGNALNMSLGFPGSSAHKKYAVEVGDTSSDGVKQDAPEISLDGGYSDQLAGLVQSVSGNKQSSPLYFAASRFKPSSKSPTTTTDGGFPSVFRFVRSNHGQPSYIGGSPIECFENECVSLDDYNKPVESGGATTEQQSHGNVYNSQKIVISGRTKLETADGRYDDPSDDIGGSRPIRIKPSLNDAFPSS
jgi:hypothetical protein